ncbi:MAG: Hpt domain-containing protein [Candidatus Omnitrophica bacterium]|nr:Hpt domain-containing protein [Candidatus Omnitrophota bacterium]
MDEKILDLAEFMERIQGDKALALELLDIFVPDFREKRRLMGEAISNNDADQMRKLSHALKGSTGNISAHALHVILAQLEDMGKRNDLTGAGALVADLDTKFEALMARIAILREELK